LKKTFAGIATLTTLFILISFAFNSVTPAKSATPGFEAQWQLTVTGHVENPLNLSWSEIVAMPKSTVNAALICVDFPGNVVMQGNWTGVKLRTLLVEAKPLSSAIKVAFFAADGYSTDLTVETAMRDNIILAYEKDGEPLNDSRLVVPGKWGYKWISMLTRIELVNYNFLGRWESQGYSDEANITTGPQRDGTLKSIFPYAAVPSNSSTSPSPSPSQTPAASQPSDQLTPTPTPATTQKTLSFPIEAIYAIAIAVIVGIIGFGAIVVRKRSK
jgi:DMSO/TMAO reductase YedYZ molybdopterin-dependent catalytic subunit